ncbi:MAG: glycosyltransferase involved in cell wall biosynthesis [Myxococcota bacterium]|jgi:glycosyltransferase involved in cell wall biosynthesis
MIHGKRVVVVMPAYFAEETLAETLQAVPMDVVDRVLLVDDASTDATAEIARGLGILAAVHPENRGYGGNQKTCYTAALDDGADVVVMVHPDNQYDPGLVPAMASMIALARYDIVLGSRMHGRGPLDGGMPRYKYAANRLLTATENRITGRRLSEYHTGLRAYSRAALEAIPWQRNSDDFIFDNQLLLQAIHLDLDIGELSCPARYFPEASSISLRRSVVYGLGVLRTMGVWRLHRAGLVSSPLFEQADGV